MNSEQLEKLGSDNGAAYGDMFYKRAVGKLPEMESSKAAARRIASRLNPDDVILDVGCGVGHYLRSLDATVDVKFEYIGVDATPSYVELAQKAYADRPTASFQVADIYDLPFADQSVDVAMCNNVLLHLPNVEVPLRELLRVARRHVLVRTLVGTESFVIQHVDPTDDGRDFDAEMKPVSFHYLNIYSESYLGRLLREHPRVRAVKFEADREFVAENIADTALALPSAWDTTQVVNGMQISGYIVQPWTWVAIELG